MYVHTNLAAFCLHAAVKQALPDVKHTVLELHINQPFATQLRAVWATQPDVACFSTYIWNRERVFQLARTLKRIIPGLRVVLGGPEVSYDIEETLALYPYVTAIVAGEGEIRYPALLNTFARKENHPLKFGPPARLSPEEWPDPYEGLQSFGPERIWYAETSRGCPFHCQFCLSAGEKVRALPAKQAIERLLRLTRGGAKMIKLVDRTFNFDQARALEIWRALIELDTDCMFHFEIGSHLLDAESLALLSAVPKKRFQFEIGVQSASPEALCAIGRVGDFEAAAGPVRVLRETGNIQIHLDLIAGLPKENWASFAHGFDLVHALRPHRLQLGFLKLLPGSGLRRNAEQLGIQYASDPPYEVLCTPDLSFSDLQELHDVEKTLDWYGNSGRHPSLMSNVIGKSSAFSAYHALARWLRAEGLFDADRSAAQRAEALERYAATLPDLDPNAARKAAQADRVLTTGYRRYQ